MTECRNHNGQDCALTEIRIGVQFNTLSHEMIVNGLSTGYPGTPYITTVCEDFAPRDSYPSHPGYPY